MEVIMTTPIQSGGPVSMPQAVSAPAAQGNVSQTKLSTTEKRAFLEQQVETHTDNAKIQGMITGMEQNKLDKQVGAGAFYLFTAGVGALVVDLFASLLGAAAAAIKAVGRKLENVVDPGMKEYNDTRSFSKDCSNAFMPIAGSFEKGKGRDTALDRRIGAAQKRDKESEKASQAKEKLAEFDRANPRPAPQFPVNEKNYKPSAPPLPPKPKLTSEEIQRQVNPPRMFDDDGP